MSEPVFAHFVCVIARGLCVMLMGDGFSAAWVMLLRVLEEGHWTLSLEEAHALANEIVQLTRDREEWREPCGDLAAQIRHVFGHEPHLVASATTAEEAFAQLKENRGRFARLAAKYPGPRRTS